MNTSTLINGSQLCAEIGLSRDTLRRRVKDGTIPVMKIGRLVRYDLPAVMRALQVSQLKARIPGLKTGSELAAQGGKAPQA